MNRIKEYIKSIESAIYHALSGLFYLVFIMIILQACINRGSESAHPERPNILFIITDQQHAGMMSCAGNPYVNTPNLDQLASEGLRFERAYAANPVCVASRFSLMTGRMPSVIGMEDNHHQSNYVPEEILQTALGSLFTGGGYQTVYAGKKHLTGANKENGYENPAAYGFSRHITPHDHEGSDPTVEACAAFFQESHDQPFLLVASLINPHDICYMPLLDWAEAEGKESPYPGSRAVKLIEEIMQEHEDLSREEFIEQHCPPLPDNFDIPENELPSFTTVKEDNYIGWSRRNYSEDDWRIYRYLYARLTEVVDRQIGQLLTSLEQAGLEENTLVVFTSDHGDQDASHRTGLKGFLYEESANIPLIFKWKDVIEKNRVDREHLVSNGLDLIPTFCDFAGIASPKALKGLSLKPMLTGEKSPDWRTELVVENNGARMLLFDRHWKYMVDEYTAPSDSLKPAEMLFNLDLRPLESKNFAGDKEYATKRERAVVLMKKWYEDQELSPGGEYPIL
jgi:arylsulfatase A-like enzyme